MSSWAKIKQNNPQESSPSQSSPQPARPSTSAGPKSGIWRVLIRTVPIVVLVCVFIFSLFLFVYVNRTGWRGMYLYTTAELGDVLLVSTAACKIVFTAVPLVMAAAAYPIADAWRKRSEEFRERHPEYDQAGGKVPNRPQQAVMSEVFTAANLGAALKASLVLWRSPKKDESGEPKEKKEKDALSRGTLKKTVVTLLALLIVAYLIFIVDLILHGVSQAVEYVTPPTGADPLANQYSRVLRPECESLDPQTQRPCTIEFQPGGLFNETYVEAAYVKAYPEALSVMTNTSTTNRVISVPYQDKDVAILVPAEDAMSHGASFTASTVGTYTSCVPQTQTCDFATPCTTCNGKAPCNMSDYPSIDAFASGSHPHGVLKRHVAGSNTWDFEMNGSNGTDANPFMFLFSGIFNIGYPKAAAGLYDDTLWGKGANTTLSSVVLICSMITADVGYEYSAADSSFTLTSMTPTAHNGTIRAVSSVIDMQQSPFDIFFATLETLASASLKVDPSTGAVSSIQGSFIKSFQKAFGTTYLPFAHSAFTATPAGDLSVEHDVRGTAIPIAWLILYMVLLAIFAGLATYQAVMSTKVHLEAKWRERKEENKHEESGEEKKGTAADKSSEKDDIRGMAETFTDPIAMTFDEADEKKSPSGRKDEAKGRSSEDGTIFGFNNNAASDSMASLTAAMKGRTFGGRPSE